MKISVDDPHILQHIIISASCSTCLIPKVPYSARIFHGKLLRTGRMLTAVGEVVLKLRTSGGEVKSSSCLILFWSTAGDTTGGPMCSTAVHSALESLQQIIDSQQLPFKSYACSRPRFAFNIITTTTPSSYPYLPKTYCRTFQHP